jgi:hypothetical protein
MTRLFIRPRHVTGRWDGSRPAPQRSPLCPPISSTLPLPTLERSPDAVHLQGWPRHMPPLLAPNRPHQIGKPHSAAHADRGFLHGWLCDAKRHPKPFTIPAVERGFAIAGKPTLPIERSYGELGVGRGLAGFGGCAATAAIRRANRLGRNAPCSGRRVCMIAVKIGTSGDRSCLPTWYCSET